MPFSGRANSPQSAASHGDLIRDHASGRVRTGEIGNTLSGVIGDTFAAAKTKTRQVSTLDKNSPNRTGYNARPADSDASKRRPERVRF
jgi:hypothetical protein